MFYICSPMPERITVTPKELVAAVRVWLRTMPRRIWRELERYEAAAKEKRQDPDAAPQVHAAVADHIARQLHGAAWEVTRPAPEAPSSPPAWTGTAEATGGDEADAIRRPDAP
jgi:hypothetical protein